MGAEAWHKFYKLYVVLIASMSSDIKFHQKEDVLGYTLTGNLPGTNTFSQNGYN
jgi:hypothetical protein